jgi:hypothetical protein
LTGSIAIRVNGQEVQNGTARGIGKGKNAFES